MALSEIVGERRKHLATGIAVALVLLVVTGIAAVWIRADYIVVFYIGAMVGGGELVSRYRDSPQSALPTLPALVYIAVNAAASVAALYFVVVYDLAHSSNAGQMQISRILLGGFGAMALFRTSFFTLRIGDHDIAIGPLAFLQVVLSATDRAVDRMRADDRATVVSRCMSGVSFDLAQVALPAFCLALMQNVTADEEKEVGNAVADLKTSTLDPETRVKNLGLTLLNVVGDQVLRTAVRELGPQIKPAASVTIQSAPASLKVGETTALTAVCHDSGGGIVEQKHVAWSADDPTVASVTADGQVRVKKAGMVTISAKADSATDAVTITAAAT